MNHVDFLTQCVQDLMNSLPKSAQVAVAERAGTALSHVRSLEASQVKDGAPARPSEGTPETE